MAGPAGDCRKEPRGQFRAPASAALLLLTAVKIARVTFRPGKEKPRLFRPGLRLRAVIVGVWGRARGMYSAYGVRWLVLWGLGRVAMPRSCNALVYSGSLLAPGGSGASRA